MNRASLIAYRIVSAMPTATLLCVVIWMFRWEVDSIPWNDPVWIVSGYLAGASVLFCVPWLIGTMILWRKQILPDEVFVVSCLTFILPWPVLAYLVGGIFFAAAFM